MWAIFVLFGDNSVYKAWTMGIFVYNIVYKLCFQQGISISTWALKIGQM